MLGTVLVEQLDDFGVAEVGSDVKGSLTVVFNGVWIGSGLR